MFLEAAKMIFAAADINPTYDSKIKDYTKAIELYIKAVRFDEAENCYIKAQSFAGEIQKVNMRITKKEFYKKEARELMQKDKRKHAMVAYEKLATLDLTPEEKKEVQTALLDLYQKLGKVREFLILKKAVN